MAKSRAGLGRIAKKRGRRRKRPWTKDFSGSDDPSDEDFVLDLDENCESSCDSYSSGASDEQSCSEEEEEEEIESNDDSDDWEEERKRSKRKRRRNLKNSVVSVDFDGDLGPALPRKARAATKPAVDVFPGEEDDFDDEKDEDFTPEDEEEEEESPESPRKKKNLKKRRKLRRNFKRVFVSDDEEDDFIDKRRRIRSRRRRIVRSDDSESDSSSDSCQIFAEKVPDLNQEPPAENYVGRKRKGKTLDESSSQICGICLSEERREIIRGVLDCCSHFFCFACIMEWSKVESRCPVCKRRFKTVTRSGLSLRCTVVRIPIKDQVYQPSEEEIMGYLDPYANVVCVECQRGGDDNLMLLCDICDSPAHTYCVGLGRHVPEGNWYCNSCRVTDPASPPPSHLLLESGPCDNSLGSCSSCQLREEPSSRPSPALLASTLLGRRSIHQRIRIMLFNHRNRIGDAGGMNGAGERRG